MATLKHPRHCGMREPNRRPREHLEQPALVGNSARFELRVNAEPGVIHKDVDRMRGIGDALGKTLEVVRVGEIARKRGSRHPVCGRELGCEGLEPVSGASH